jgi:Mycothiol maleylpyruvate isomerase N-terminal domain
MTINASDAVSRATLLERIRQSWDALQETVRGLDERRITTPGPEGWSVKDHLAHLARWEGAVLDRLEGRDPLVALGIGEAQERDEDAINAMLQERDASLSTPEVVRLLAQTHARMIARVEAMDTAALERWIGHIQGNTHEHFDEHIGWMRGLAV